MSQRELTYQLQQVARRLRKLRLWTHLTCTWLVLFVLLLGFLFWRPADQSRDTVLILAISVALFATVITLFLIPILCLMLDDFKTWLKAAWGQIINIRWRPTEPQL